MPLLWTTSACSTVVYQSTIAWNCLVASTACANFAGTTRRVPFPLPLPLKAELAGIAGVLLRRRCDPARSQCRYPLIAVIDQPDKASEGIFRARKRRRPPVRAPLWERTGGRGTWETF